MVNKVDVVVLEIQCDVTEEISLHSEPFCFYGHLQDRKVASKMALKYTKK